jgi:hypothetical protein
MVFETRSRVPFYALGPTYTHTRATSTSLCLPSIPRESYSRRHELEIPAKKYGYIVECGDHQAKFPQTTQYDARSLTVGAIQLAVLSYGEVDDSWGIRCVQLAVLN